MFTKNFYASLTGAMRSLGSGSPQITLYDSDGTAYTTERAMLPASSSQYKSCLAWYEGANGTPSTYATSRLNVIHNGTQRFFENTAQNNTNIAGCVIIGDGNTEPTINDVALSGNMITSFTATTAVSVTGTNGTEFTAIYNITNTGDSAFTVKEIALTRCGMNGDNIPTSPKYFLMDRTVLTTPITIQPNETKAIVYRINMFNPS